MSKDDFFKKLVPKADHGFPVKKCMPEVVYARAVTVKTEQYKTESLDSKDHVSMITKNIVFEFTVGDELHYGNQIFITGNVIPELGQWVRGVCAMNQWGSYHFITTHLMKVKDE